MGVIRVNLSVLDYVATTLCKAQQRVIRQSVQEEFNENIDMQRKVKLEGNDAKKEFTVKPRELKLLETN